MDRIMVEDFPARRTWANLTGGVVFAAAAIFVYWPALNSYFASDDWVLLHHYGPIPPGKWWQHFSSDTIWFYRPLQSLQFGLTYQWFGLNERVFNGALLAMHLGVMAVGWGLARAVTGRTAMAWVATILFATHWVYLDLLIWKANYNTLQWAAATLGACWCFRVWLLGGGNRALAGALTLTAVNFLTKEMAVNLPVMFLVLWVQREWEVRQAQANNREEAVSWIQGRFRRGALGLGIPGLMVLAYVALHRALIQNIEPYFQPGYRFVWPWQAWRHFLAAWNHALLGMGAADVVGPGIPPAFLPVIPRVGLASDWPLWALVVAPGAVLGAAIWLKDARVFVAWAWIVVSFLPAIFLDSYFGSRFFYLPAYSAALALAILAVRLWDWGMAQDRPEWRVARLSSPILVVWLAVGNGLVMQEGLSRDSRQSFGVKALFEFLRSHRGSVEPGSLIVFRGTPQTFFNEGLGAREMVKMALQDPQAEAVIEFQRNMTPARVRELNSREHRYIIDLNQDKLSLQRVAAAQ